MRQRFTIFAALILLVTVFTGCADEKPRVVVAEPPQIEVSYNFWTGARHVEVDGEIINDGPGYAAEVELEFQFFDRYGDWVQTEYRSFIVELPQKHSTGFFADFGFTGIHDIDVRVAGVSF